MGPCGSIAGITFRQLSSRNGTLATCAVFSVGSTMLICPSPQSTM